MYYEVIPIKVFRQDVGVLTYSSAEELVPGQLVQIPLGKLSTSGIVLKKVKKVDFSTKPIIGKIYETPIPRHLLQAILWLAEYYLAPLPTVANLALPSGINKSRREKTAKPAKNTQTEAKIALNPAQKQALEALQSIAIPTKLLHGVTGSGKTNIYLKLALECLKQQKSTILLVPEIALTSQLVQVFEQTFGDRVVLLHSRQTEATRHRLWEQILESEEPLVMVGPRSALFAPVKDLGLIIIDEAHEGSYFQDNAPHYSALRLASQIAGNLKISCVQGTATPLVTDYYLAEQRGALVSLKERAKLAAKPPEIKVVDIKNRDGFRKNRYFSDALINQIKENLENGHQTLIYHNRRGSAPLTLCEHCGWQALCPNCFLPLTLHTDNYMLVCHTCGHQEKVPLKCPDCGHLNVIHKGFGTKLLEMELKNLFSKAKIARFDADNKKAETLAAKYQDLKLGNIDIVVGTQIVAKGLDLPKLASVGIVQADAGLSLPDFSAEERSFHLLTQAIGRVGRGHLDKTTAIIQSYQPDNPIIKYACADDYQGFYNYLLKKRAKTHLPPFAYLARYSVTYKTEKTTLQHIRAAHRALAIMPGVKVSPPMPAFHERTASGFTWQIVISGKSRTKILQALKFLPNNNNTHFVIDPPSLL